MKSSFSSLIWIRHDLRIRDNPALSFASRIPGNTVAVYIHEEETLSNTASSQWLTASLAQFATSLQTYNIPLLILHGSPNDGLEQLILQHKVQHVCWNSSLEPNQQAIDIQIQRKLSALHIEAHIFQANFLFDLNSLRTKQGKIFQIFTPFYKTVSPLLNIFEEAPPPQKQATQTKSSQSIHSIPGWIPGEDGAWKRVHSFISHGLSTYETRRDLLGAKGTSELSPHLHFGELSIRSLVNELQRHSRGYEPFIRQLIWREFAAYLLLHFPNTTHDPLRAKFAHFPWRYVKNEFQAWTEGQTGIPIVDAGMRELQTTGWMHNRARMIVASFLTKHLLHPWQEGAQWFMKKLYDADLANNSFGWQWVAGCGADAAPFFRIFNPVLQGKKFDKEGNYVRHFVPELKNLPNRFLHNPWDAPKNMLQECRVRLNITYPVPIITPEEGRKRALTAFRELQNK